MLGPRRLERAAPARCIALSLTTPWSSWVLTFTQLSTSANAALTMHFALPPRKGAASPPYARAAARISATRRTKQFQFIGYCLLGLLTIWLVLRYTLLSGSSGISLLDDDIEENIVIVTVLDDDPEIMSPEYVRKIKANRDDYALRHGTYQSSLWILSSNPSCSRIHKLLCQCIHVQVLIRAGPKVLGINPSSATRPHSPPSSHAPVFAHTTRIHNELQPLSDRTDTES